MIAILNFAMFKHVVISSQLEKDGSMHFATAFGLKAKMNAINRRVREVFNKIRNQS